MSVSLRAAKAKAISGITVIGPAISKRNVIEAVVEPKCKVPAWESIPK